MPKVQVQCPSCASTFNLADDKLGKKIRCTECSAAFVAEEADQVGSERVRAKGAQRARSSQGRKKGIGLKKKSGGSGVTLAVAGGIGAVGLVVVGLFLAGVFSGKRPPQPPVAEVPPVAAPAPSNPTPLSVVNPDQKLLALKWLPAETDVYVHIKVSDLLQLQQVKDSIREMESSNLADVKRMTGLSVDDIVSISLGVVDAIGAWERSEQSIASGQPGTSVIPGVRSEDERTVIVVSAKKAVDIASLQSQIPMAELKERNQRKYIEFPSPHNTSSKSGLWTPDDKTIICGTLADVQGTIDRGETVTPRPEFATLSPTTITVAMAYKPTTTTTQPPPPSLAANFRGLLAEYGLQGAQLGISFHEGFDLDLSAICGSNEGAAKLKGVLEEQLGKESPLAAFAEMANLGAAFEQLKPVQQGQSVKLTTHLPESFGTTAAMLPAFVMSQASSKRTSSAPAEGSPLSAASAPSANRSTNKATSSSWTSEATFQSSGFDARYLSFTPDGRFLACGSSDGFVDAWDVATKQAASQIPSSGGGDPIPVEFHPSRELLAIANMGNVMRSTGELVLWDFGEQAKVATIVTGPMMTSLHFNSGGSLLAASQRDRVSFWDVEKHAPQKPDIKLPGVWDAVFSPDGSLLATISSKNPVKIWDVATRKEKHSFKLKGRVVSLTFTPDGESLAAAEAGAGLRMWDVSSGKPQTGMDATLISSIAFSPDGHLVAVGISDGMLTLWDRKTFNAMGSAMEHEEGIYALQFSPDGKRLASGSDDDTVKLWDVTRFRDEQTK